MDRGVPISEVAARFQVSWTTVKRWVDERALEALGVDTVMNLYEGAGEQLVDLALERLNERHA